MNFIIRNWKAVFVVVLIALAFAGGRALAPTKVQVVERVVKVKEEVKIQSNAEQKTSVVYVDRPVDRVVTKTVVREPTGKVTETVTDSTHTGNTTVTSNQETKVQVKVEKQIVYQDRVIEKTIDNTSSLKYEFGAQVGYSLARLDTNYVPSLPKDLVVGAFVNYNLTKNLKAGVWLNSQGSAGGQVSFSF